ncbi:MAG: hypothetical protein IKL43_08535 [Alistipes sp.]|nr:hypothetical protein [Alistipes sp.]
MLDNIAQMLRRESPRAQHKFLKHERYNLVKGFFPFEGNALVCTCHARNNNTPSLGIE